MEPDGMWSELASLPAEAQAKVAAYIARLKQEYSEPAAEGPAAERPSLADEPFVGMWRDREDMADSTQWVRGVREREWAGRRG